MDNSEFKKIWYKSKTIIVNSFIGLLTLFNEIGGDFKNVIQENLPFLKDIDAKWYVYAVIFLIIFNIVNRKFINTEIKITKKTKK